MLRRGRGLGADGGGGPWPGRGDQSTRDAFGSNRHERPKKTEASKIRRVLMPRGYCCQESFQLV